MLIGFVRNSEKFTTAHYKHITRKFTVSTIKYYLKILIYHYQGYPVDSNTLLFYLKYQISNCLQH